MQYDEFVGQVQNRARLASRGEAVSAIRATLETLGERLAGGAADNLAAQLPSEIGEYLRYSLPSDSPLGTKFGLDEFFQRMATREKIDLPIATYHARVVTEVLQEAVSPGELEKIRAQLPDEFDRLFAAGSVGAMPPRE
jgi:uncharacterized protein (DUF2267 family)